jgi:nitrous oxidase accessory protein NosD
VLVRSLAAAATTFVVVLCTSSARSATIVVGPAGTCPGAIFTRIQSALDAAVPGSTVVVCAGEYPEQLLIAKRVRILGSPGTRIVPGPLAVSATSLRSGRPVAAAVTVRSPATIDGIVVDATGHGIAGCDGTEPLLAGVYVRGVAARVSGTAVTGTRIPDAPPGCANGVGILAQGSGADPRVRFEGNTVDAYQRAGIVVQDGARAWIRENFVVGDGDTPGHAQAGIEVATGALARVEENVVRGHAGPSGTACDLDTGVVIGAARARVRGNQLEGNAVGLRAATRGHTIRDNAIDGGAVGVIGLHLAADESRVSANVVSAHAATAIRVDGNRSRLRGNLVADVHESPRCTALRETAGCAASLARCGVGVWLLGRANQLVATVVADVDTPVVDDGRANVVR